MYGIWFDSECRVSHGYLACLQLVFLDVKPCFCERSLDPLDAVAELGIPWRKGVSTQDHRDGMRLAGLGRVVEEYCELQGF